ncbi:MAG: filamentous hemagglutinin N-terminal domain-containing protein, partial [Pseudomonadota bacterium]|nr:filamentous hemagglutinin N-terminal domain-containing protein [Pseudomonadota bacterium]
MSRPPLGLFRKSVLATAVAGVMAAPSAPVIGNPSGAEVIHGTVDFQTFGNEFLITNSNGAIINWQDFSIAQGEITRFQQEAANSAVLNRVVGGGISEILGSLVSNGKVFLINPNGVVFGQNVTIDTAGFVASTLDMANEDFLAGNYTFEGSTDGQIVNEGYLATRGGNVFFVAANIENSGVVHAEDGSLVLAAGERVRIRSLDSPEIEFELAAPDNSVLNLGALLADQGAVKAFAGTLTHSGEIRANQVSLGADGSIHLYAADSLRLESDSVVDASGANGGDILIEAEGGTLEALGTLTVEGTDGTGGRVRLLSEQVGLLDGAVVNADGTEGGGQVLIGGAQQGLGPEPNASDVYVDINATVGASSTVDGDGGEIIVFAAETARVHGDLTATGGPEGGDGGFIETSASLLSVTSTPNAGSTHGAPGEWLIDPDLIVVSGNSTSEVVVSTGTFPTYETDSFAIAPTIGDQVIEDAVNVNGTSVRVLAVAGSESASPGTGGTTSAIFIDTQLDFNATVPGLTVFFESQDGDIFVNQPIINTGTQALNYQFDASTVDFNANVLTNGGAIDLPFTSSPPLARLNGATLEGNLTTEALEVVSGINTFDGDVSAFTASISGGEANFLQGATISQLSVTGGVLDVASTLDVNIFFDWSGGDLRGAGTLTVDGIGSGTTSIFGVAPRSLTDLDLVLKDQIFWDEGDITVSGDAAISIDGTLDIGSGLSNRSIFNGGLNGGSVGPAFNITSGATVDQRSPAFIQIAVPTNNQGAINAISGELALTGGGTSSGTFSVDAGAILRFEDSSGGGGHTLSGPISGFGGVIFSGSGTAALFDDGGANSYSVDQTTVDGASVQFAQFISQPSVNIEVINGGNLNLAADVDLGNLIARTGATIDAGGGVSQTSNLVLDGGFFTNAASGDFLVTGSALLNNANLQHLGLLQLAGTASGSSVTLNGSGTTRVTGTNSFGLNQVTINTGVLEIQVGAQTNRLDLLGGELALDGGDLDITTDLVFNGGLLRGTGTLSINSDSVFLTTGTIGGDATLKLDTAALGSLTGSLLLEDRARLEVRGVLEMIGDGASLTLDDDAELSTDGALRFLGDGDVFDGPNDPSATTGSQWFNSGTIEKTQGGSGSSVFGVETLLSQGSIIASAGTIALQNELQTNGAIVINSDITLGTSTRLLTGASITGAPVVIGAGSSLSAVSSATVSVEAVTVQGGTLFAEAGGILQIGNALTWNTGTIGGGAGTVQVLPSATGLIDTLGTKTLSGGNLALDSAAGVIWAQGNVTLANEAQLSINGAVDVTASGASLLGSPSETLFIDSNGALAYLGTGTLAVAPSLVSTGLTRVGGAGTLRFDAFAQIGDVEATNGTLSFTGGGLGTNPTIVTQAPGVIDFGNGFTLDNAVFPPSNSGTILGNFTLSGALTSIDSAMTFRDVAITTTGTLAINAP